MEFDRALGRGPEGPSYAPRAAGRYTRVDRIKAFFWYRFGWGHRPQPRSRRR